MYDYDVICLGSGHAAWRGGVTLAAAGKKVAVLDNDLPGGTCTNYGCDAKILLDGPFAFPTQTYMLVSLLIPVLAPLPA